MLLISNNSFEKFFKESILFSIDYSTSEGFGGGLSLLGKIKGGSNLLVSPPLLVCTLFLLFLLIKTSSLTKLSLKFSNKVITIEGFALFSLCIFLLVGFLTITIPGNEFPHYLLFFIWTIVMFCTAFAQLSTVFSIKPNSVDEPISILKMSYYGISVFFIVAMVSASSLAWSIKNIIDSPKIITNNDTRYKALGNSEVLQYCPIKSQVLVWGWSSELFAYFDWIPPSDVVNEVARIKFSNLSEGSRARIARAVSTKKAECVYEAIGAQYFGGFDVYDSIESLAPIVFKDLNQNYRAHILEDGTKVWSLKN